MNDLSLRSEPRALNFQEILIELKKPFPPEDHKERELKGGKKWFFVPWQTIRSRLNEVCPEWEVRWENPILLGEDCSVVCTLTIAGISRQAIGVATNIEYSSKGNVMSRGTGIERAVADGFKNAAENFGVCAYLDDQEFVIKHLRSKQDYRAQKFANENAQIEVGARGQIVNKNKAPVNLNNRKKLDSEVSAILMSLGWTKAHEESFLQQNYAKVRYQMGEKDLEQFLNYLRTLIPPVQAKPQVKPQPVTDPSNPPQPLENPPINRDLLMQEIDSLCKRRGVDASRGKTILIDLYGVCGRSRLTDAQLISFRDYLQAIKQPQAVN